MASLPTAMNMYLLVLASLPQVQLDLGGVFELYSKHPVYTRLDVSDMMIRVSDTGFQPDKVMHTLPIGIGIGYRFK